MAESAVPKDTPEIPDKLYFRIGEAAGLLGLETYVLRYWETEFPTLAPKKSGTGHRLYRRKDVELLLKIKHLLYDKRFTIEGARQWLQKEGKGSKSKGLDRPQGHLFLPDLAGIRDELAAILQLLK